MKFIDRAYQYYNGLPTWGKGVVIVGGGMIAWFGILNPIRKVIINKLSIAKWTKEGREAGDQITILRKQGIRPTISEAQAESFSNSLVKSFNDCGTDEDAVYRVMSQLKNDADVYLLINKYGVRKYAGCGPWNLFQGSQESSLSGAISDELDSQEKQNVNNILEHRGIKFRFT